MAIILVVIVGYSIDAYVIYWWLLMVIGLMAISGYCINVYWLLFYWLLLMVIGRYFSGGY